MSNPAETGNAISTVRSAPRLTAVLLVAAELLAITVWALYVTRPYQIFDPDMVPVGREYLSAIMTNHTWIWARECGLCALWNGAQRGGAPTFADPYGSMLHPLVAVTTLGWGVRNGAKIALVVIFIFGGIAQWWLARVLGLGAVARVWSGMLAVVAGHLGARAENGNFGLLLSTVACALALPPLVALARGGGRRTAVVAGIVLASAVVAGQGYMQIALACVLPLLLFLPKNWLAWRTTVGRFVLAGGLALLLGGVFLVPFIHFLPEFGKYLDPEFRAATAFQFMPLHLVIDDTAFYQTEALNKLPYPYLYANFIGWLPVLLALAAVIRPPQGGRRVVLVFAAAALLVLWIASGAPLQWLAAHVAPLTEQMTGLRFHPIMAGLAIPFLLALAAITVDQIVRRPPLQLGKLTLDPGILLLVPLLAALLQAYSFNRNWITTIPLQPEVKPVLATLQTPTMQWINPPFGEHPYMEPALELGMKMSDGFRTWNWKNRMAPFPEREADRKGVREGMRQEKLLGDISINTANPGHEYAALTTPNVAQRVCAASGKAGDIDVRCGPSEGGTLVIQENSWNGWGATIDGQPVALQSGQWLSVALPPGDHLIAFRYRPWDVALGAALSLIGMVAALAVWWGRPGKRV